jgi:hypothetical protein
MIGTVLILIHDAFYCMKLKRVIQPTDDAILNEEWGWVCDCGIWYKTDTNQEIIRLEPNYRYVCQDCGNIQIGENYPGICKNCSSGHFNEIWFIAPSKAKNLHYTIRKNNKLKV